MKDLKQRIKDVVNSYNMSMRKFEAECGVKRGVFSNMKDGAAIGSDKLALIFDRFKDLNPDWLLTGRGEMLRVDAPIKNYKGLGCPYYNVDFQGGFELLYNNQTTIPEYHIDFGPYNMEGGLWCNVSGKSMEPEISNGDIILIKEVQSWQDYIDFDDIYGIVTNNGFRTIKRVKKGKTKDSYTLVPTNPDYDSQEIQKSMIMHIFKVLCAVKRF